MVISILSPFLRPAATLAAVLLLSVPLAAPCAADEPSDRIALLSKGTVEQRLEALRWLAENGDFPAVKPIVEKLKDSDTTVRSLAEFALWSIWARSGDPDIDGLLRRGTQVMTTGDPAAAIEIFDLVINRKPEFAEGYNKRATAFYLLGEYDRSLADVRSTLKRNPFHFGALSGAGFCMIRLERLEEALFFLGRALKINPNLESVIQLQEGIANRLQRRSI